MAIITSRETLIAYCLRSLGAPVVEINVDEDQLEDRIDEALQFYRDYHSDAVVKTFRKHKVTEEDVTNGYLELPDSLLFVSRVLPLDSSSSGGGMFSVDYQLHLNDVYGLKAPISLLNYEMTKQHMALLDFTIGRGTPVTTFSRHQNRIIFQSSSSLRLDEYVIVEGYENISENDYPDVFNDRFLKQYATALIKKQWGTNLKKFEGMQLPGGVTINGQQIFDEANTEIEKLEEEMDLKHSMPADFFIG